MSVKFTGDAEKERIENRETPSWSLFSSTSLVHTLHKAKELGWGEEKVQVRAERIAESTYEYHIEPFEKCGCPNLLKYSDYFI